MKKRVNLILNILLLFFTFSSFVFAEIPGGTGSVERVIKKEEIDLVDYKRDGAGQGDMLMSLGESQIYIGEEGFIPLREEYEVLEKEIKGGADRTNYTYSYGIDGRIENGQLIRTGEVNRHVITGSAGRKFNKLVGGKDSETVAALNYNTTFDENNKAELFYDDDYKLTLSFVIEREFPIFGVVKKEYTYHINEDKMYERFVGVANSEKVESNQYKVSKLKVDGKLHIHFYTQNGLYIKDDVYVAIGIDQINNLLDFEEDYDSATFNLNPLGKKVKYDKQTGEVELIGDDQYIYDMLNGSDVKVHKFPEKDMLELRITQTYMDSVTGTFENRDLATVYINTEIKTILGSYTSLELKLRERAMKFRVEFTEIFIDVVKFIAPIFIFVAVLAIGLRFLLFKFNPIEQAGNAMAVMYVFIGLFILGNMMLLGNLVFKIVDETAIKTLDNQLIEAQEAEDYEYDYLVADNLDVYNPETEVTNLNEGTIFIYEIVRAARTVRNGLIGENANIDRVIFLNAEEGKKISPYEPYTHAEWDKMVNLYYMIYTMMTVFVIIGIAKIGFDYILNASNPKKRSELKHGITTWILSWFILAILPLLFQIGISFVNSAVSFFSFTEMMGSVLTFVSSTNAFIDGILKIMLISMEITIILLYAIRKIYLTILFVSAPIYIIFLLAIKPEKGIRQTVWFGEFMTNLIMPIPYAAVFTIMMIMTKTASFNWIYSIAWLSVSLKISSVVKDSIQGLWTKKHGIDELGEAKGIRAKIENNLKSGAKRGKRTFKKFKRSKLGKKIGNSKGAKLVKRGIAKARRVILKILTKLPWYVWIFLIVAMIILTIFLVKGVTQTQPAEDIAQEILGMKKVTAFERRNLSTKAVEDYIEAWYEKRQADVAMMGAASNGTSEYSNDFMEALKEDSTGEGKLTEEEYNELVTQLEEEIALEKMGASSADELALTGFAYTKLDMYNMLQLEKQSYAVKNAERPNQTYNDVTRKISEKYVAYGKNPERESEVLAADLYYRYTQNTYDFELYNDYIMIEPDVEEELTEKAVEYYVGVGYENRVPWQVLLTERVLNNDLYEKTEAEKLQHLSNLTRPISKGGLGTELKYVKPFGTNVNDEGSIEAQFEDVSFDWYIKDAEKIINPFTKFLEDESDYNISNSQGKLTITLNNPNPSIMQAIKDEDLETIIATKTFDNENLMLQELSYDLEVTEELYSKTEKISNTSFSPESSYTTITDNIYNKYKKVKMFDKNVTYKTPQLTLVYKKTPFGEIHYINKVVGSDQWVKDNKNPDGTYPSEELPVETSTRAASYMGSGFSETKRINRTKIIKKDTYKVTRSIVQEKITIPDNSNFIKPLYPTMNRFDLDLKNYLGITDYQIFKSAFTDFLYKMDKLPGGRQAIKGWMLNRESYIKSDYLYDYLKLLESQEDYDLGMYNIVGDVPNLGYMWPTPDYYTITSKFGMRYHPKTYTYGLHTGLDIRIPAGGSIVSSDEGKVVYSQNIDSGGYGKYAVVEHGAGYQTLYAHNSNILVSEGQTVEKGQEIAKAGSTGVSTGNHLHFEIRDTINKEGDFTNPNLLEGRGINPSVFLDPVEVFLKSDFYKTEEYETLQTQLRNNQRS